MSKEIANYDEMLAQMAKAASAVEKPSGASISARAGMLQYNGSPVPGNKLDVIIVASKYTNLYYEDKWDPNNIASPVCFAYGDSEEGMTPHPASAKPQSADCKTCPQNQWGSDPNGGKGKACKNSRALGLIPAGITAGDASTAEVAVLKLPVMSVKNWQAYVQKCKALYNRPPLGVVTEIGTVPDAKSQFRITFTDKGVVDVSVIGGLIPRLEDVGVLLQHVYEAPAPEATEAAPAKAKKF